MGREIDYDPFPLLGKSAGQATGRRFEVSTIERDAPDAEAFADLQAIVRAHRLSRRAQASRQAALLRELLAEDRQSR